MFHIIKLSALILDTFVFVELPGGPEAACVNLFIHYF